MASDPPTEWVPVRVADGTYCCHLPYLGGGLDIGSCCGVAHRKRRAADRHARRLSARRPGPSQPNCGHAYCAQEPVSRIVRYGGCLLEYEKNWENGGRA
jgi:hypothetical protein